MANKQDNGDLQSYTSFISSSFFHDDVSIKNELSLVFNNDEDALNIAFQSFSEPRIEDAHPREKHRGIGSNLELKRATSFEDMLMENHRTVLIDSIRQYFIKIQHEFLKTVDKKIFKDINNQEFSPITVKQASQLIEVILVKNSEISQATHNFIMNRVLDNPDEMSFVAEILKICPKNIQFEVLFLVCYILQECNEIIQHFKRKNLAKELKRRSLKLASELKEVSCLGYLFQSSKVKDVTIPFEVLIQKWMITLFLMKIGIFENELETKSIDDCLKSQIFSKIDLNDLLNQHLIHPSKKVKKSKNDIC